MKLPKLFKGRLIKRYKRFLADIVLENGEEITAHVPNSGAMTSCIEPNCMVYVSFHDNPKRKLKYTLELTNIDGSLICTNTNYANKIGFEAIKQGKIKELLGYKSIKTEQKYGLNSRIDILLENQSEKCFIEIKSVSLKIGDTLAFPDAVTSRGTKHLHELIQMKKQGHRCVMLYIATRSDSDKFRIAKEIDKTYFETLKLAISEGVEVLVYGSKISTKEIKLDKQIHFYM
ncbi:MAG: DNA/RNA nuclease SfsA [Proteobacteria bacterium]|nr:MAG: DNA/RNA nuclease SfsA [Pseudomonadota bacterium]